MLDIALVMLTWNQSLLVPRGAVSMGSTLFFLRLCGVVGLFSTLFLGLTSVASSLKSRGAASFIRSWTSLRILLDGLCVIWGSADGLLVLLLLLALELLLVPAWDGGRAPRGGGGEGGGAVVRRLLAFFGEGEGATTGANSEVRWIPGGT